MPDRRGPGPDDHAARARHPTRQRHRELPVTDTLAHTWDIGHGLGLRIDPDLVPASFARARDNVLRVPGFFGPELAAPRDTDEHTCWLAYLGRSVGPPVSA